MTVNDCFLLHSPSDEGEAKRSTPADAQFNKSFNGPTLKICLKADPVASRIFWLITNMNTRIMNMYYVPSYHQQKSTETAGL